MSPNHRFIVSLVVVVVLAVLGFGSWHFLGRDDGPPATVAQQAPVPAVAEAPAPAAETAAVERPAPEPEPEPVELAFDVVRVEPTGEAVIAGRGAPGARVELLRNGETHDSLVVDATGAFAFVPPPLPAGASDVSLRATLPNGEVVASRQSVTVVVDESLRQQPMVAMVAPGEATVVLSRPEPAPAVEPPAAQPVEEVAQEAAQEAAQEVAQEAAEEAPVVAEDVATEAEVASEGAATGEAVTSAEAPVSEVAQAPEAEAPTVEVAEAEIAEPALAEPAIAEAAPEAAPAAAPEAPVAVAEAAVEAPPVVSEPVASEPVVAEPVVAEPARPEPPAAPPRASIRIASVEAETGGGLFVTGEGAPLAQVRLYLNDTFVARAQTDTAGAVSFAIGRGVMPGAYQVRLDDVADLTGQVLSRAEVSFEVPAFVAVAPQPAEPPAATPPAEQAAEQAPAEAVAESAAETPAQTPAEVEEATPQAPAPAAAPAPREPATVTIPEVATAQVTRGDSLWRISRQVYGRGVRYTEIFEANKDQIRDPNLIYPGQIFVLPADSGQAD